MYGHIATRPKATQYAAAFTVAALGEMLPIVVEAGKAGTGISRELLSIQKGHFGNVGDERLQWQIMYYDVKFINADSEADARANMLIYLLEHKLIPPNGGDNGMVS